MMKTRLATVALSLSALSAVAVAAQPTDAQIDAAFKKADPDGDGTVSKDEAKKFGIKAKAFASAESDKDGTLDKKEFVAALTAQFDAADPDKDGTLDTKEAGKVGLKSKKHFAAADPDKDMTVDFAEYLAALTAKAK